MNILQEPYFFHFFDTSFTKSVFGPQNKAGLLTKIGNFIKSSTYSKEVKIVIVTLLSPIWFSIKKGRQFGRINERLISC